MSARSGAAGPRWRPLVGLAVLLVLAGVAAFVIARATHRPSSPAAASTPAGTTAPSGGSSAPSSSPLPAKDALATTALRRSTCATSVAGYAPAGGRGDDSAAFAKAMTHALAADPTCYAHGPSGPQAVVYVPPGTYRLDDLAFPSDVRMEVDAGATLQLPSGIGNKRGTSIIDWTSAPGSTSPVTNVSLVGVGTASSTAKAGVQQRFGGDLHGLDPADEFTMDLDAATTGASNLGSGMNIVDAHGFLVQNVFTIQNATDQPKTKKVASPTSATAVIRIHSPQNSPASGAAIQSEDGVINGQVNVGSPAGFGPNQINSGDHLTIDNVFSVGGTALRLETDGSLSKNHQGTDRGASIDDLQAANIIGVDCNRAVSLAPHAQRNGAVRIAGVWSYGCYEAVDANFDGSVPKAQRGLFTSAVVTDVHAIAGNQAQGKSSSRLWAPGPSYLPTYVAGGVTWHPSISDVHTSGHFTG